MYVWLWSAALRQSIVYYTSLYIFEINDVECAAVMSNHSKAVTTAKQKSWELIRKL